MQTQIKVGKKTAPVVKANKVLTRYEGFENPYGFDDLTLYKPADFEVLQNRETPFRGYLLGYKSFKNKKNPGTFSQMFYFITTDGELMKVWGSGNLSHQLNKIIEDGHIKAVCLIEYLGLETVDIKDLGDTEVNQWKVLFNKKDKTDYEVDETLALLTTIELN